MKKFYFVKLVLAIFLIYFCNSSKAQVIIPGGAPAHFGIDADVKSDTFAFGTSMPAPAGNDDWFKKVGGTGLGIIDTTGAAYAKQRLQSGGDYIFNMPNNFPRFSTQNGNLLLDAHYARDGAMTDSTYFAGNGQNAQDPTTWPGSTTAGSPLDKCDIVDTYVHLRRDGPILTGPNQSHLYLMLAASVVATTGSHYMDFELYKQPLYYTQSTGRFSNSGPTWSGGHTKWDFNADGSVDEIGDMQIGFTYNNSSVTATNIYIWVSLFDYTFVKPQRFDFVAGSFHAGTLANYGYAEITAITPGATLPIWGLVNSAPVPAPFWGTTSKDLGSSSNNYYSTNYATGQLAEVAIDFTALGTDPAFNAYYNPCEPPYTRFIAKTRSSGSFSAALKDFTGPFPFVQDYTPPPNITPPGHLSCNTTTVNLKPDSVKSPAIYEWSTLDGNIISSKTDTPYITVNKTGTYVLKTSTYKGCFSLADSVVVTNDNNKPVAKAGGPYYVTNMNPIAQLIGGDASASNYSTPYGGSQGLIWKWNGPNNYLTGTQYSDAADTGTYTLTITEARNGCTASAPATVIFLSTLPIKVTNFAAAAVNKNTIDVKWTTASEDGNESYILERSTDGIHFTSFYKTGTTKASTESNYGYRDDVTGVTANSVYYRVKIYSHSVLYSVSNIAKVSIKAGVATSYITSVVQNGVKANAVLNFYAASNALVSLKVVGAAGVVLYQKQILVTQGINTIQIPAQNINGTGIKFIQLNIDQEKLSYKFLSN